MCPKVWLLLSDLGHCQYLDELAADREVDRLYADALEALVTMQTAGGVAARSLPAYDRELLLREMQLFLLEWSLVGILESPQGDPSAACWIDCSLDALVQAALSQPAVFVHRDYHSRNLLLTAERNPGILDFQDAVRGPITYDAVFLKDCYIEPGLPERVQDVCARVRRERLERAGVGAGRRCR